MSVDLLHIGPLLLVSFAILLIGLTATLVLAKRRRPDLLWLVTLGASVVDCGTTIIRQKVPQPFGWAVVQTAMLVTAPVLLGGLRINRLTERGTSGILALASGVAFGLGVGWLALPIVLLVVALGLRALTS